MYVSFGYLSIYPSLKDLFQLLYLVVDSIPFITDTLLPLFRSVYDGVVNSFVVRRSRFCFYYVEDSGL